MSHNSAHDQGRNRINSSTTQEINKGITQSMFGTAVWLGIEVASVYDRHDSSLMSKWPESLELRAAIPTQVT
jgi:hypothetical protein